MHSREKCQQLQRPLCVLIRCIKDFWRLFKLRGWVRSALLLTERSFTSSGSECRSGTFCFIAGVENGWGCGLIISCVSTAAIKIFAKATSIFASGIDQESMRHWCSMSLEIILTGVKLKIIFFENRPKYFPEVFARYRRLASLRSRCFVCFTYSVHSFILWDVSILASNGHWDNWTVVEEKERDTLGNSNSSLKNSQPAKA